MRHALLPEFQKYLISRGFVPEKKAAFYAYWVSGFLAFSNTNEDLSQNLRIERFLNHLKRQKNIADWQYKQAENAVRLYISYGGTSNLTVNSSSGRNIYTNPKLVIQKARQAMRLKHYSYKTESTYLGWIRRFYAYIRKKDVSRHPLKSNDVRDYLSYLAIKRRVSSSTQNQAFNALLFLFREVLMVELGDLSKTVRAKRGPKLPVVLTVEEVKALFKQMSGKNLLAMQLLYGAGLRLMELARLRVKDIDFGSDLIFVRAGKGDKDRSTILPGCIKEQLQLHIEEIRTLHQKDLAAGYGEVYLPDGLERKYPNAGKEWKWQYVFPSAKLSADPRSGKIRRHHIGERSVQNAVRMATKKAEIIKQATVHTLRHSFATHLLMNGVNIREVQELLGHKNIETTMVYMHVLRDMSNIPKSPLDEIWPNKDSPQ